jgi:exodeoxyribonuclease VII large subunit
VLTTAHERDGAEQRSGTLGIGAVAGGQRTVEDAFGYVRLRGEVSGWRGPHASGHCYFALKDETARIDAIIWRGTFQRLKFPPEEGMEVIATGRLTTYPGRSTYQIVIERIEPAGIGALMALLEERRKKLAAEGLFAEDRKRPIPYLPRVIGVVTSPTGAVIRDILHRLSDRFPTHVLVWPARVQGEDAATEIAAGIRGFNELAEGGAIPKPDAIIVARGGGSLEDLWAFNEEIVVRAAAGSAIPLISAVGHETDWTLIDHAADLRAPTPTAAAEMAVPVRSELVAAVSDRSRRLVACLMRLAEHRRNALKAASRGLPRLSDLVARPRQRLDEASGRLPRALLANARAHAMMLARVSGRLSLRQLTRQVLDARERLSSLGDRAGRVFAANVARNDDRLRRLQQVLDALSYERVLERGFALVEDEAGALVRSSKGHASGKRLSVTFADGTLPVVTEGDRPAIARRSARRPAGQASLFDE